MGRDNQRLKSACVFCGSSDDADPEFRAAATQLGKALADAGIKLVYGGGGVGLMGAVARAAHHARGEVLGIIPTFLVGKERALETVEVSDRTFSATARRSPRITAVVSVLFALPALVSSGCSPRHGSLAHVSSAAWPDCISASAASSYICRCHAESGSREDSTG